MLRIYYHPHHASTELSTSLGSSSASTERSNSWITDRNGNAIQYMHYLPYGEEWIDQKSTSWNAPYTFTGKIKDAETGYNYFGARYYDSGLSVWLSVDPMSDKYPSMSPYNYCANNPVILVDPDGKQIFIGALLQYMPGRPCPDTQSDGTAVSNTQKFIWGALNTLNEDCLGSMVIAELAASQTTRVDIEVGILADERAAAQSESVNNTTSSKITISDKASKSSNLTVALAHELFHSYQTHFGDVTASIFSEVEANIFTSKIFKVCYMYNFEKGNDCQQEDNFNTNVMSLVYNSYTYEILNNVVSNFKYFSSANSKGLYDNFPLYNRSNQKSLLMELLNK